MMFIKSRQIEVIYVLVTFLLVTLTMVSCAPDKNRRDRLTRVHAGGGTGRVPTNRDAANDNDNDNAAGGNSKNSSDSKNQPFPETDSQGNEATVAETEVCKVTEAFEGISETQKALPLCGSIDVKTDADGTFQITNFIGTIKNAPPYFFKQNEITVDQQDSKSIHLSHLSEKSTQDIFYIAYQLNEPLSKIDKDSVTARVIKADSNVKLAKVEVGDSLQIHIENLDAITNINFKIEIDYRLK